MTTATLPLVWRGRSGREYVPAEGTRVRHGGMATVRRVHGRGGPVGSSTAPDAAPLALKMWNDVGDEASLDQLQREAKLMADLAEVEGELPCPRLYDLIGTPLVTGLVMEWCPADLERWWRETLREPDAFGRLMAAMSEVARRVSDYHRLAAGNAAKVVAHGDLKPSNILISADGRWLISDFGTVRVEEPDDEGGWATSRVVAGTENFLAPEVLFHAKARFPAAVDTWALGATTFALLRLRRMVMDGGPVPRNGTHSPRFRMARMSQVLDVYGQSPTRFHDRDLDASAFPDNLGLPGEDRQAVLDSLREVFGDRDTEREETLAAALFEVLDRAMSIDPAHRYTDSRALSAAFEGLVRTYIALTAQDSAEDETLGDLETEEVARNQDLEDEVERMRIRVAELEEEIDAYQTAAAKTVAVARPDPPRAPAPSPAPPREAAPRTPGFLAPVLGLMVVLQLATLVAVLAAIVAFAVLQAG